MDEKCCQFYTNFYQYFDKVRFVNKKLIFIFRMMLHDFGERKKKKERYTMCI